MADSAECCFGFFNVCGCAWAIAMFNMGFFGLTITVAILLCIFKTLIANFTLTIIAVACLLLVLQMIFYFNYNLRKATYVHNILHVKQWLMFHSLFYIIATTLLFCAILASHCEMFLAMVVILIGTEMYQIHIVKRFYNNERTLCRLWLQFGQKSNVI